MRSPPVCASWILPRHRLDCVNRWCKRGQKGQYFQAEYVILNRCGGKKMLMNKECRGTESSVLATRAQIPCIHHILLSRRGNGCGVSAMVVFRGNVLSGRRANRQHPGCRGLSNPKRWQHSSHFSSQGRAQPRCWDIRAIGEQCLVQLLPAW